MAYYYSMLIEQFADALDAFIASLSRAERKHLATMVRHLATEGHALTAPHSKALGGGLFELRHRTGLRVFYTFRPGDRAVVLGGFVKKRTDIPPSLVTLMRHRAKVAP